jgi:hypothetical protein
MTATYGVGEVVFYRRDKAYKTPYIISARLRDTLYLTPLHTPDLYSAHAASPLELMLWNPNETALSISWLGPFSETVYLLGERPVGMHADTFFAPNTSMQCTAASYRYLRNAFLRNRAFPVLIAIDPILMESDAHVHREDACSDYPFQIASAFASRKTPVKIHYRILCTAQTHWKLLHSIAHLYPSSRKPTRDEIARFPSLMPFVDYDIHPETLAALHEENMRHLSFIQKHAYAFIQRAESTPQYASKYAYTSIQGARAQPLLNRFSLDKIQGESDIRGFVLGTCAGEGKRYLICTYLKHLLGDATRSAERTLILVSDASIREWIGIAATLLLPTQYKIYDRGSTCEGIVDVPILIANRIGVFTNNDYEQHRTQIASSKWDRVILEDGLSMFQDGWLNSKLDHFLTQCTTHAKYRWGLVSFADFTEAATCRAMALKPNTNAWIGLLQWVGALPKPLRSELEWIQTLVYTLTRKYAGTEECEVALFDNVCTDVPTKQYYRRRRNSPTSLHGVSPLFEAYRALLPEEQYLVDVCIRLFTDVMKEVCYAPAQFLPHVVQLEEHVYAIPVSIEDKRIYDSAYVYWEQRLQYHFSRIERSVHTRKRTHAQMTTYTPPCEHLIRLLNVCAGKHINMSLYEVDAAAMKELRAYIHDPRILYEAFDTDKHALSSDIVSGGCAVCIRRFIKPLILSCGHAFCMECIYAFAGTSLSRLPVKCPLCRTDICTPKQVFRPSHALVTRLLEDKIKEVYKKDETIMSSSALLKILEDCDLPIPENTNDIACSPPSPPLASKPYVEWKQMRSKQEYLYTCIRAYMESSEASRHTTLMVCHNELLFATMLDFLRSTTPSNVHLPKSKTVLACKEFIDSTFVDSYNHKLRGKLILWPAFHCGPISRSWVSLLDQVWFVDPIPNQSGYDVWKRTLQNQFRQAPIHVSWFYLEDTIEARIHAWYDKSTTSLHFERPPEHHSSIVHFPDTFYSYCLPEVLVDT